MAKTKSGKQKGAERKAPSKKQLDAKSEIEIEDDEDYDDEVDSQDKEFIADDDEVEQELERAKKRERRELKKQKKLERKLKRQSGSDSDHVIDDEDIDLLKENKALPRKKLKKNAIEESDQSSPVKADEQIDSTKIKNEVGIKKQIFDKRGETTTADDQEMAPQNQTLKDVFVHEDIDDYYGTPFDQEIVEKDIPERLQIKLNGRLNPDEKEIEQEAEWIFKIITDTLHASKDQSFASKIQEVKQKICRVLKMFRTENCDIPYITRYRQSELIPELQPQDVWRIFNLDIEYGKFQVQKKQCEEFFTRIGEFGDQMTMDHYKNQIYWTKNQRELNDFSHLINFYKSYYQKELEQVQEKTGKKFPVQKKEFVFNARQQRLDEFSRRCMLNPIQLVENIHEDKQLRKPNQPQNIGPTEMAKEYLKQGQAEHLDVIKDMCVFTAIELSSQPDIRKGFKKHIYEYGVIQTQPTDKGLKELDVFHPSYRVKRVEKRIIDIQQTDLFLDILQNEQLGLIKYEIVINDDCEDERIGNKFFSNMFEKFRYPDDQSKWKFLRREIFEIFSSQDQQGNKGQKSFLNSIMDEIKNELKEDAENTVLNQCSEKYQDFIMTGYFKKLADQKPYQKQQIKRPIEEDIIPQRERLTVMGAIMHPIDNRNFLTTVAIVDEYGELVAHRDFLYIIPPRKPRQRPDGAPIQLRPAEEEERKKHEEDKRQFQELLREHQVDLIVVSADCLEAKKLKNALLRFANLNYDRINDNNDDDRDKNMDDDNENQKEAVVVWGRPEIPKLFAQSHYSQKLLKNQPFVLKKAVCLARFEQDPMNEILNLWSPIMSENQALHLNLHPLQKYINQSRLMDHLEEINVQAVNKIGIDINLLVDHEHWHNQLQFLSGLGPRKAQRYIQRLKSLGKPLYTRNDIYDQKLLQKYCFISSFGQTKVRVPPKKRPDELQYNIMDQTRIHYRNYDTVFKIVTECVFDLDKEQNVEDYKKQKALNEVIKNPNKLKEFAMGPYREKIREMENQQTLTYLFDQIIEDLLRPFMDPREDKSIVRSIDDPKFSNKELFYNLIDESERTFKEGMIVSATVLRVYEANGSLPPRIMCKLENGLDATINQQDADFFVGDKITVDQGSIITGRVAKINFSDKSGTDENFSVILKCKQSELRRHDNYIEKLGYEDLQIPEEDLININFKQQEEQTREQKRSQIQKRKIQHQRFQNISSVTAVNNLKKEDNGEFYFRPSSRGTSNLTLTWKFYEGNIVHIDIQEYDKAVGANIGQRLKISDEYYENLQEIVERYITPCNRSLREVVQHPKFMRCQAIEDLKKALEAEKAEDNSRIPYRFTVIEKYPQYVIMGYIPKKEMIKEFIKVKPRGYFFHHQYHYPFQNMINWFKQEFRSREYQRYLRKSGSPQLMGAHAPSRDVGGENPSNMPMAADYTTQGGMQIDQGASQPNWGNETVKNEAQSKSYGRGQRASSPGGGWGQTQSQQSQIKDERERANDDWGNTGGNQDYQSPARSERSFGAGRGRGRGGGGGGSGCFKCGQDGHFARECPNAGDDSKGKSFGRGRGGGGFGGGGDRGPKTCFNCNQEGHISRDCPEPRKPRRDDNGGGDPYKRRRGDDGGSQFRRNDNESSWKQNNTGGNTNAWGAQPSQNDQGNSEGGGWGDQRQSQSQNDQGGW